MIIVDDLSNSSAGVLDGIQQITGKQPVFVKADCGDATKMSEFLKPIKGIKAIIHFAASKAVGESVEKPLLYYRNNLLSLLTVLDSMKKYQAPYLFFLHRVLCTGNPIFYPLPKMRPPSPQHRHSGNTKQIAEEIIRDTLHAEKDLKMYSPSLF